MQLSNWGFYDLSYLVINEAGPAASSGSLKAGDFLLKIDKKSVTTFSALEVFFSSWYRVLNSSDADVDHVRS